MGINIVDKIDGLIRVRNILVSVSDKSGLDTFIPELVALNPDLTIYSTGGTYHRIQEILGEERSSRLIQVSDYTGQPETQGGLVKTLDFKIYLGILTETYNDAHIRDLERTKAVPLDMVIVNLYPFKETVAKDGVTVEMARGNIDIGGPCMIRASAKNFLRVASVVDPSDYERITAAMASNNGSIPLALRYDLARKAFRHTADYDTAIAGFLENHPLSDAEACYRIK